MGENEHVNHDLDPLTYGVQRGTRVILDHFEDAGQWDLPPELYGVVQGPLIESGDELPDHLPEEMREALSDSERQVAGTSLEFSALGVPAHIWSQAPTAQVIAALAAALAEEPAAVLPAPEGHRLIGLVLVCEAWTIMASEAEKAALDREPPEDLSQDPRSVEVRVAYGVDNAGYTTLLHKARGSEDVLESFEGPGNVSEGLSVTGEIPRAMAQLLEVLVGEPTVI